jgi:endo-1,4-beta-xylanase
MRTRPLLRAALAAPGLCALLASLGAADAPPVVPLWDNGAPGFESRRDVPEVPVKGGVAGIQNPSLTVFLPPAGAATGSAVVILPGGGHRLLVIEPEGYALARWLAAKGVAGFVLKYRLARDEADEHSPYRVEVEALQDAKRAMRLVRSRAAGWGIDPARIGIAGFSAGGELAAMASMSYDAGNPAAADRVDREGSKPAFQALIYPGGTESIAPTRDSPPAFLVCGNQDRPDISEGLAMVYFLFKRAGVPAELHIYSGVGHGFDFRTDDPRPVGAWGDRFYDWMAFSGFLRPAAGR